MRHSSRCELTAADGTARPHTGQATEVAIAGCSDGTEVGAGTEAGPGLGPGAGAGAGDRSVVVV